MAKPSIELNKRKTPDQERGRRATNGMSKKAKKELSLSFFTSVFSCFQPRMAVGHLGPMRLAFPVAHVGTRALLSYCLFSLLYASRRWHFHYMIYSPHSLCLLLRPASPCAFSRVPLLTSVFLRSFPTGLGGFLSTASPRQLFVTSSFVKKYKGSGKDLSMLRLLPPMI